MTTFDDTKVKLANLEITYKELDDAAHALVHKAGVDKHTLGVALGCMQVIDELRQLEERRQRFLAHPPPSGWYTFGTHAGWENEDSPPLEFSKEADKGGLPLYERPAP